MRKTLTALLTGAAIVLGASAAHAGTQPPIYTVHGGAPVLTHPITVKSGKPVLTTPKHHKKTVRAAAMRRTSPIGVTPLPPVYSYLVKTNLWQHTSATDSVATRIQIIPGGTELVLNCWTTGPSVSGDSVWYQSTFNGHTGYSAGWYIQTGHDPVSSTTHC